MTSSNYPTTAPAKYNVLSIVALIGAFVVPLIGAVIGFVALGQIKKSNERGRNLALAGIVLGFAFTVIYLFTVIVSAAISAGM